MRIELCNTTRTLLEEIADVNCTRENIVLTYAFAIRSSEETDWVRVNRAIVARWSLSALTYIKRRAWKMVERKAKPDGEVTP